MIEPKVIEKIVRYEITSVNDAGHKLPEPQLKLTFIEGSKEISITIRAAALIESIRAFADRQGLE